MMHEGKIHVSVTRARAFFESNPAAELSHEDFRQRFGFTSADCARQGLYMLHLEGVAQGVQMVRSCAHAKPADEDRQAPFRAELAVLSARQIEVLCAVAKGLTASEIAAQMGLSKHTVDVHRQTALERLDCTLPEAVVTLAHAGYV